MGFSTVLVLAVALSMDAFAVSIINSMCYEDPGHKKAILTSLAFGVFQGVMPLIGYWAGSAFASAVSRVDHWIAFVLLAFIGGKMLWEAIREWNEPVHCPVERTLTGKLILTQAVATSIDALAVGITFAFLRVDIMASVVVIGVTTFALSLVGVAVGHRFGARYEKPATVVGGVVLILIGLKILLEHLGILTF